MWRREEHCAAEGQVAFSVFRLSTCLSPGRQWGGWGSRLHGHPAMFHSRRPFYKLSSFPFFSAPPTNLLVWTGECPDFSPCLTALHLYLLPLATVVFLSDWCCWRNRRYSQTTCVLWDDWLETFETLSLLMVTTEIRCIIFDWFYSIRYSVDWERVRAARLMTDIHWVIVQSNSLCNVLETLPYWTLSAARYHSTAPRQQRQSAKVMCCIVNTMIKTGAGCGLVRGEGQPPSYWTILTWRSDVTAALLQRDLTSQSNIIKDLLNVVWDRDPQNWFYVFLPSFVCHATTKKQSEFT